MTEEKSAEAEEVKQLITELGETLKALEKPLMEQFERLNKIIPRGVVDPQRWITVHRPELLKDEKLASALKIWETLDGGRYRKKFLRKKSHTTYTVELTNEEAEAVEQLLRKYYETDWSRFYLNMAKHILDGFEDYYSPGRLYLNPQELGMFFRAFTMMIEDSIDQGKIDEDELEEWGGVGAIKLLVSLLKKTVKRRKSITIPSLKEDGFLDYRFETKEDEVTILNLLRGEFKQLKKLKEETPVES